MSADWQVCLPISLTPKEFAAVVAAARALGQPADEFVKGAVLREGGPDAGRHGADTGEAQTRNQASR